MSMDRWMQKVPSFRPLILDWPLSSWIDSHPGLTLILDWHLSWIENHPGLTLRVDVTRIWLLPPWTQPSHIHLPLRIQTTTCLNSGDLSQSLERNLLYFKNGKFFRDYTAFCTMHVRLKGDRSCSIIAALLHLTSEDWDYAGVQRTDRIKWRESQLRTDINMVLRSEMVTIKRTREVDSCNSWQV